MLLPVYLTWLRFKRRAIAEHCMNRVCHVLQRYSGAKTFSSCQGQNGPPSLKLASVPLFAQLFTPNTVTGRKTPVVTLFRSAAGLSNGNAEI